MKTRFAVCVGLLLASSACAHNPRPESPEQRAERQAQSLREQQNAEYQPRSVGYTTQEEADRDEAGQ
jgi:hypothetical protein